MTSTQQKKRRGRGGPNTEQKLYKNDKAVKFGGTPQLSALVV